MKTNFKVVIIFFFTFILSRYAQNVLIEYHQILCNVIILKICSKVCYLTFHLLTPKYICNKIKKV